MRTALKIIGMIVLAVVVLGLGVGLVYMAPHASPLVVRGFGFAPRAALAPALGLVLFGLLVRLFTWVLVIAGVVWLVSALVRGGAQPVSNAPARETPMDILKARYARGEINKEQYEQLRHDMET